MITTLPSIAQAGMAIRDGQLEPMELVEFCLQRIEQHDEQLRAWVVVDDEGAKRQAEELSSRQKDGQPLGPLHGIPLGIKDIVDVAGLPTKAGSPLRTGHCATQDAPLVTLLRKAGAIVLGKTVTTEFACFDPSPTHNPWNLQHTPGGSSSGSAAAVAAEMCMAAVGSQTGGSITRPAAYCGVAGLKPTFGAVSLEGIVPISFHLDHAGPIARSVRDLAAMFFAMTEVSPDEQATHQSILQLFDKIEQEEETPAPYLAVVEEFFLEQAEQPVRHAVEASVEKLGLAGAVIGEARLPASFADGLAMHRRVMAVDAAMVHRETFLKQKQQYGPNITTLIEAGLATTAVDYSAALAHQRKFQHEALGFFTQGNVLLTPAASSTAPASLKTTGDPKFNSPWSYAGLPVVNLPCGLAENGLPCGIQLVGPPHSEALLLYAAAWCEKRLGFGEKPGLVC